MIAWLTDTLIYTGLLIGLVLVLRGPIARAFGPQMAYALWALPLLRFIMPPIVLPSSLAPQAVAPASDMEGPRQLIIEVVRVPEAAMADGAPVNLVAPPPAPVATDLGWWFDAGLLVDVALAAWLTGAVAFLAWRGWTYDRMRRELLAGSRPVGDAGKVRLVETPAVGGPIAFGVFDKVIALPMEFMAWGDRRARDLAIEHELAHHRGGDLLANMLAQPVLALHWFNPLAWLGWRAMRRDQEAACDARVMAWRTPRDRAFYGEVIASFATGPRLALAAPMACPMGVLGEKSIIHRLRSLNMTEISPRRRIAGRTLLAGAALAVPLTASISYAEAQVPPSWPAAPEVPAAPEAAEAPEAPKAPQDFRLRRDRDVDVDVRHEDGKKIVTITREIEGEEPEVIRHVVIAPRAPRAPQAARVPQAPRIPFKQMRQQMSEEEWEKHAEQWEKQAEAYEAQWEKWGEEWEEKWEREWSAGAPKAQPFPQGFAIAVPEINFDFDCDEDGNPVKVERADGDHPGVQRFVMCQQLMASANARAAIERARASVERDRSLSEKVRGQVLRSLDRELRRLSNDT